MILIIKQAIILAGGLGTSLRTVIKDVPKPMADINGKPFLEYLLNFVSAQGVKEVIISCGYKYDVIKNYFKFIDREERYCCGLNRFLEYDGALDLIKAVYNRIVKDFTKKPLSFKLSTYEKTIIYNT